MGDEQISMARGNRGSYMNGMRAGWNVNMKNQVKKTYGKITGKGHCRVRYNLALESFPVSQQDYTDTGTNYIVLKK